MEKIKSDTDMIEAATLIAKNANNVEFITKTIWDIYQYGYSNGYFDAESVALKAFQKVMK